MVYVAVACQTALLVVFGVSSATKLRGREAYRAFRDSLRALRWLPQTLVAPAAALTVVAEVATVLLLVVPAWRALGFAAAAALLTVFSAGIAAARRRGASAPCRCFGRSTRPLGWAHVARNAALLAVAGTGWLALVAADPGAPLHPGGVAVAVAAGVAVGGLSAIFDEIVELFAPTPLDRSRATAR